MNEWIKVLIIFAVVLSHHKTVQWPIQFRTISLKNKTEIANDFKDFYMHLKLVDQTLQALFPVRRKDSLWPQRQSEVALYAYKHLLA